MDDAIPAPHQDLDAPAQPVFDTAPDDPTARLARLFLEDYVTTSLLRLGRPLKASDLLGVAEGFSLSRAALKEGMQGSRRVTLVDRDYDLTLRVERKKQSREERARQPLEAALDELLRAIGKPLPLPVVARELAMLRGVLPEAVREAARNVLRSARFAVEVAPEAWLHASFLLEAGAPREELVIRENHLASDPDFADLRERALPLAEPYTSGDLNARAVQILQGIGFPVSQKVLGFLLWQQDQSVFEARSLARVLVDRKTFYPLVGGVICLQSQLPLLRAALASWTQALSGAGIEAIDVATLLRQRVAPHELIAPRPAEIEELARAARASGGQPIAVAAAVLEALEIEPDDARFVPALQGLNEALRRDPAFLPAGSGRFLLREAVPSFVGEVPEALRPVHLSVRDPVTDEPLDFEMSDDGLEGDAAVFVHDPHWEDISEEVEVKLPRRAPGEPPLQMRYVLLNHHYRAGTIKLRRLDEEFFALESPLSRLTVRADDGQTNETLGAWASHESGLIYGLSDWLQARAPASGGVLEFARDALSPGTLQLKLGAPDKLTLLGENRIAQLESLREQAAYLSLFDLLQSMMDEHAQGAELPTLWAEINAVRRTTKRLMASVLCGYHCFYFKQRGPKQILWRFDRGKLDQGLKRNKRKYVRR